MLTIQFREPWKTKPEQIKDFTIHTAPEPAVLPRMTLTVARLKDAWPQCAPTLSGARGARIALLLILFLSTSCWFAVAMLQTTETSFAVA